MHDIEIDQSGRTDQLTVDTVLAFSDAIQAAILIPKAVKRECYHPLKEAGVRKDLIGVKLFAAGLILLLIPYIRDLEEKGNRTSGSGLRNCLRSSSEGIRKGRGSSVV